MTERIAEIGHRVLCRERLSRDEILSLLEAGRQHPHELLHQAHRVRTSRFSNAVKLCSIVAGKLGGCAEDCKWCAQSARYAASAAPARQADMSDIRSAARHARKLGAGSFGIVNSGRRPGRADLDAVLAAVKQVASDGRASPELCASLGELTGASAEELAAAGVARYNHNLETSRRFFPSVVTTHSYDDRLRTLDVARAAGMELCCGGIFGIGETWEDRVDLALTLRDKVNPAVVPLNFLHPISGTPLAGARPLEPPEVLTVIAMFRLVLPDTDIKIAGGREISLRSMQSWMFYAGATSCLIGNYLTTYGRDPAEDLQMIRDLGLTIVQDLPNPG